MSKLDRRTFLKNLTFGRETRSESASRVLVCIFLRGGADTLNMFVPYADSEYYKSRPTIGIPAPNKSRSGADASIKMDDLYSLHPRLSPILPIYKGGRLAVIQSVGSDNPTGSHFATQDQIEHGESYGVTIGGGWIARYLRAQSGVGHTPLSAVSIGTSICESLNGAPSASALNSIEDIKLKTSAPAEMDALVGALSSLYGNQVDVLTQPGSDTIQLLKRVQHMHNCGSYVPAADAKYGEDQLSVGLKEIARLIKADVGLQVACIDFGGWDTHFVQGASDGIQAERINLLGKALATFDSDLVAQREHVTTLVMTEFGRRTYENGSLGTDHGQAAAMIVMGGGVHGGKVYGNWSGIADQEIDLLGPSGLRVKYDYRSVLAELLAGPLSSPHVDKVFPGFKPTPIGFAKSATKML